ncbi:endonuclease YncB(thermonuclease family) [Novosphingobium chloroacetimidivorans]|uniref:Endonuclease YncB(Thermonuclease family) n=1 Tax=Novosphingobium chloroacetimidivorans TaxID=1428314 RepID=A0A7W7NWB8_9SPHN|nr:thermonuclease family protein [Novosphingobium chloroacetimidivorans]MBB4859161.1 endonuclease YncB(thermonuclease family) [Novosphingobium chloroacetimidivorans]
MRRVALLLSCALLAGCNQASGGAAPDTLQASADAVDGDTVSVHFRLLGVDAVERRQQCERKDRCWKCGKAASSLVSDVLDRAPATIAMTGEETYGRPVAIVSAGGKDLGLTLIRTGFAVPMAQYLRDDPERLRAYEEAYAAAKADRIGMHAGEWIEPGEWRKGRRLSCERRPSLSTAR